MRDADPGSSPLARGLLVVAEISVTNIGIIPARAGFTQCPERAHQRRGDHPRSRGVYLRSGLKVVTGTGSSPLARGLPADYNERISKLRIIPARAGFTHDGGGSVGHGEDHPRSRGVYAEVFRKRDSLTGSSPLARGLRRGLSLPAALGGIIPARAGFTRRRGHLHPPARDHPRSRGVY